MISFMEKRVDERVDLTAYAKFKILSDSDGAVSTGYEEGTTLNISRSGLCMQVPRKLVEGNVIRIEISAIGNSARAIKAFCEVQWCVKKNDNTDFEAGLSFIALKEEDIDYLNLLVEKQKSAV